MRLIGCVRVSRVGGRAGESFISPQVQRDQCEAYAQAHGHTIVAWQEDLDQPGSTLNRPGLQAALTAVDSGQADGIIAAKLDRVTRSIADLGKLLERARAGGWNLVAVDVGLDMATPNGKLVAHVLGAIAEWELDRRRADWNLARERAVDRGVHIASRTPTGYRRLDDGRMEPTVDADTIRELFRRRAAGDGWKTLAAMLTTAGVVTPYGNTEWTAGAARHLIKNRVYLGEARSGSYVAETSHTPLVTEAEWYAAQTARGLPSARTGPSALLSGLIRCSGCRYVMKADSMRDRDGTKLAMYRCRRIHAAGRCTQPVSILARVIEPRVEQSFLEALGPDRLVAEISSGDEFVAAVAELEAAHADLAAYIASDALAIAGARAFEHGLTVRREVADELERRVSELRSSVGQIGTLSALDAFETWPDLTTLDRREVLAAMLECVVVWPHRSGGLPGDRITLVWRGEAPPNLPRRGLRVPLESWPDARDEAGPEAPSDT